jgi:predicted RNA-binding protein with RPS1 domain
MTADEVLAQLQGMKGSDKLDFSIIDTQQQPEQSSRKRNSNQSDESKKHNKRRKIQ